MVRNRIRRRIREAVRLARAGASPQWDIVINPRRVAVNASFEAIQAEVERLVRRCGT